MIGIDPLLFDLSYVRYILSDARFTIQDVVKGDSDNKTKNADIIQELTDLLAIYDASHAQIRHDVYATAPVRTEPRRIYNPSDISPTTESDNAPILLAQMSAFDKEKWSKIKISLEAFGQASGLFKAIDIRHLGRSKTGPFQISFSIGKVKSSIVDVGYGVSQVLPIVYEILVRESRSVFLFQQPEVHLHPKAQAELATFMTASAFHWNHRIFIETHSDYLIDRIRMDVRDSSPSRSGDTNILYLKRNELDTTIHQLNIDENGNILNAPEGYREFFLREKARSIGIA
ncbi:DUF3696 domain-containing protein [Mesorhizobium sp.]|uniref:AAA family ATPase n=1 Tax=Mesorhizobium sp. TaxID=1871066 RepID=UPI0034572A28